MIHLRNVSMAKWGLFIVILLCASSASSAQVRFGSKAGMNNSNSSKKGAMIGSFIEIKISDTWAVQTEPMYIQKGIDRLIFERFRTEIRYHYIDLHTSLKYMFREPKYRPFLFLGPNIGVNVSARGKQTVQSGSLTMIEADGTEKILNAGDSFPLILNRDWLELGLHYGGGIEIVMNSHRSITFDLRSFRGLTNLKNKDTGLFAGFIWRR